MDLTQYQIMTLKEIYNCFFKTVDKCHYTKIPNEVLYFICFALDFSYTLYVLTIQIKTTYWKNRMKTNTRG